MPRLITLFFVFIHCVLWAQNKEYKVFKNENNVKISEGLLVDGKPEGYWINYYPNRLKKSEGNRKNFLLDSVWNFYNDQQILVQSTTYKEGLKHGIETLYYPNKQIKEIKKYCLNILCDTLTAFDENGKMLSKTPYREGKIHGLVFVFNEDSLIIETKNYDSGFLQNTQKINRTDAQLKKQGTWVTYSPKGIIQQSTDYVNNLKHGYEKTYNAKGNLIEIKKYQNGIWQVDAPEVTVLEGKTKYHANGKVKSYGAINKDGKKEGTHQFNNENGDIERGELYKNDVLIGKGGISLSGIKNGYWEHFYANGDLQAKGVYKNDKKIGEWIFYYPNGKIEQIAYYNNQGLEDKTWYWFFETGDTLSIINYIDGDLYGDFIQKNDSGKVVAKGVYKNGEEEGFWFYIIGQEYTYGKYENGLKTGIWKSEILDGTVIFIGEFQLGLPIGKHQFWFKNGKPKKEGRYSGGEKNGDWYFYGEYGEIILTVTYKNGIETHYNQQKINPENQLKSLYE